MPTALRRSRRRNLRPWFAPGALGEPQQAQWLWYDSFATAAAAPLSSSAANPGPGTTHYGGTTGSKSGGNYVEDVGASAAGVYQNSSFSRTQAPLVCAAFGVNFSRQSSTCDVGFSAAVAFGASSMRPGLSMSASLSQIDGTTAQTTYGTSPITNGSAFDLCVFADAVGGYSLWRPAGAPTWTLAGLTRFDTTATIYARFRFFNAAGIIGGQGVAQGVPLPVRYPIAASGAQLPAGDFMAALRLTSTATNGLKFRVSGNNYFLAQRTNAGQLNLTRYDSGSPTSVAQTAMTAAANDRIYVRLEGNTLRLSGHPTGGTWVNLAGQTITQHASNLGVEVLDETAYDSLEVYPLAGHTIKLPRVAA